MTPEELEARLVALEARVEDLELTRRKAQQQEIMLLSEIGIAIGEEAAGTLRETIDRVKSYPVLDDQA